MKPALACAALLLACCGTLAPPGPAPVPVDVPAGWSRADRAGGARLDEDALVPAAADIGTDHVNFLKALGGGWRPLAATDTP